MPRLNLTGPSSPLRAGVAEVRRTINYIPTLIESGTGKQASYLKQAPGLKTITLTPAVYEPEAMFSEVHAWPALKSKTGFASNSKSYAAFSGSVSKLTTIGAAVFTCNVEFDIWFKELGAAQNIFANVTLNGANRAISMTTVPTASATGWSTAMQGAGIALGLQLTGTAPEYQITTTYEPRRHPVGSDDAASANRINLWAQGSNWPAPVMWTLWNEGLRTIYDCLQGVDASNNPLTETSAEYYTRRSGLKLDAVNKLMALYNATFTTSGGRSLGAYSSASGPVMVAGDTSDSIGRTVPDGRTGRAAFWDAYDAGILNASAATYAPFNDFGNRAKIFDEGADFNGGDYPIYFTQSAPSLLKASDDDGGETAISSDTRMGPVCERLTMTLADYERPEVAIRCWSYWVGGSDGFLTWDGIAYTENHAYTAMKMLARVPLRRVPLSEVNQAPTSDADLYAMQGLLGLAGIDPGGQTAAVLVWNEKSTPVKVRPVPADLPAALAAATPTHMVLDEATAAGAEAAWDGNTVTMDPRTVHLFVWSAGTSPETRRDPLDDGVHSPNFLRRTDNYDRPKRSCAYFDQVRGVAVLKPVLTRSGSLETGAAWSDMPNSVWTTLYVHNRDDDSLPVVISVDYGAGKVAKLTTTVGAITNGQVNQITLLATAPPGWAGGTRVADIRVEMSGASDCWIEAWFSGTLAKANAVAA